ncbi:pilus assembly protein PilQ [Billgrantia tianxiuensis]|jgi:type IV pilus assembly protein PilP|uniref:Pilus assembly protein PilQ n=1 Tax=Billgrantia tianxiuensis TaxID=2497861 RepID=A0A6I6SH05_9GAMM|nr:MULTISPECIES: pilus assembly protein PilP [Halomonas]MCE8033037.1 pilus assembly protein PilP [Halomonas sp. MCCC 1A11057]QHC48822.1 pilus assembly protein PilQ [Halomonas tianxiuensis]
MKRRCSWGLVGLLLAGCADPQLGDLDRRLSDIRHNPGTPRPLEMPAVPDYEAVSYQIGGRRSPFQPQLPEQTSAGSGELAPDSERDLEALEAYDLAALRLVGTLTMSGQTHALVKAPDGEVHRLRAGHRLGRNHGRIVSITGTTVQLVELVPAGGGGWTERTVRLLLDEARR